MTSSLDPRIVDELWYYGKYPDVARSGMSAFEHYVQYGKIEGRLPRRIAAVEQEHLMWQGFSKPAIRCLTKIIDSGTDDEEVAYAHWALCRWYAARRMWEEALPHAIALRRPYPFLIDSVGATILIATVYQKCEREADSVLALDEGKLIHGPNADYSLAYLNIKPARSRSIAEGPGVFQELNDQYFAHGLCGLSLLRAAPFSLDSLCAPLNLHRYKGEALVSVIMPVHNGEQFVTTAIRGLLQQTYDNFELIVVDDCSDDNTWEILRNIGDPRVKPLRHKTRQGPYAARNSALSVAKGKFITTHDADDWSHPQRLELMVRELESHPNAKGVLGPWVRATPELEFTRWRAEDRLIHLSVSTLMFSKDVIDVIGYWDNVRAGADSEFLDRVTTQYGHAAIVRLPCEVPLVFARQHPRSITAVGDTHLQTQFHGVRRDYKDISSSWHRECVSTGQVPYLPPMHDGRLFHPPSTLFRDLTDSNITIYDVAVYGRLSLGCDFKQLSGLITRLTSLRYSVAIFNWPSYLESESMPIHPIFLSLHRHGRLRIISAGEHVETQVLLLVGEHICTQRLDNAPRLKFERAIYAAPTESVAEVIAKLDAVLAAKSTHAEVLDESTASSNITESSVTAEYEKIRRSGLFDYDWYELMYPDIVRAKQDGLLHYIVTGHAENRSPNPYLDLAFYEGEACQSGKDGITPLGRYINGGAHLYSGPKLHVKGKQPLHAHAPTVLLCLHSVSVQIFGAERSALDVLWGFSRLSYNVVVTVPNANNGSYIAELLKYCSDLYIVPSPPWTSYTDPISDVISRFTSLIKKYGIAAVHVNTIMLREPLLAAQYCGIPSVTHVREIVENDEDLRRQIGLNAGEIVANVTQRSTYIVANSQFTAKRFVSPNKTYIVPNGVDAKRLATISIDACKPFSVLLISSNIPKKGIYDFVQIAEYIYRVHPEICFSFVGPDNQFIAQLKSLKKSGAITANIDFLPYADTIAEALKASHVVMNLSRFEESFGRTVVEAMAAGRPVVSYRYGALPEIIEHYSTGLLAEFGNFEEASFYISQLYRDKQLYSRMSLSSQKAALSHFDRDAMATELGKAYQEICS